MTPRRVCPLLQTGLSANDWARAPKLGSGDQDVQHAERDGEDKHLRRLRTAVMSILHVHLLFGYPSPKFVCRPIGGRSMLTVGNRVQPFEHCMLF